MAFTDCSGVSDALPNWWDRALSALFDEGGACHLKVSTDAQMTGLVISLDAAAWLHAHNALFEW